MTKESNKARSCFRMHYMKLRRQQAFTLLEIMIALAIITMSIIPIISIPSHAAKKEIQLSRELDIDREVSDLQLLALRELVRQEIPWEIIVSGFAQAIPTATAEAIGWTGMRRFAIRKAKPQGSRSSAQVLLVDIIHAFGPPQDNAEQFFKDASAIYRMPVVIDRRPEVLIQAQDSDDDGQDSNPQLDQLPDDVPGFQDLMDRIDDL